MRLPAAQPSIREPSPAASVICLSVVMVDDTQPSPTRFTRARTADRKRDLTGHGGSRSFVSGNGVRARNGGLNNGAAPRGLSLCAHRAPSYLRVGRRTL